jgi:Ni,Fe-hydrogenase III small subunit
MPERPWTPRGPAAVLRRLLGRALYTETLPRANGKQSIFVRHVDGGSSNASELELTSLNNPVYDLAQYGIQFVASPRHADVLLLTGPLVANMLGPLQEAFAVMPEPRAIITVGDFADLGGRYGQGDEVTMAVARLFSRSYATVELPDDLRRAIIAHVPGDPPAPSQLIEVLYSIRLSRQ